MNITNFTSSTITPATPSSQMFPNAPEIQVTFDVDSDTLCYTYVILTMTYPRPALGDIHTSVAQSNIFYTSHVQYSIPYPTDVTPEGNVVLTAQIYGAEAENMTPTTVATLTEKVSYPKYDIASTISAHDFYGGYLKAFCNFNNSQTMETYCRWEKSVDGINYTPITFASKTPVYAKAIPSHINSSGIELPDDSEAFIAKPCYLFEGNSENDSLESRLDILEIPAGNFEGTMYSFKIFTLKELETEESFATVDGTSVQCAYTEDLVLDYSEYMFAPSASTELLRSDFPNAASGKLFYSNHVAFSYGIPELKNNVLASNVGELATPISRVIDLPARSFSKINSLASWRDYIIAATDFEMYLISKVDRGFSTKVISTFIGVPTEDRRCFKATANGLIFKSHDKVYMFYPNTYSSDESVLNLTDISKNIEELVLNYPTDSTYTPFALSTETSYYLVMPDPHGKPFTKCLKYSYNTRVWTYFEYPVLLTDYRLNNVNDIVVYGYFNGNAVEYRFEAEAFLENCTYGDWLDLETPSAIAFELDSGQKTDSLNRSKQFVESKFNVVTLHEQDCFPMSVTVHIDGSPFVATRNVNTDSAFWSQHATELGTLATTFTSEVSDIFNVFRQMFIRYSGKGKSIRHIIEGESVYPFKIYEVDYRYRNLNIKQ